MIQKKFVCANLKSNFTLAEFSAWCSEMATLSKDALHQPICCMPYPFLAAAAQQLANVMPIGVQDISPFPAGSYTGAVCSRNLADFGVQYSIVGHSERRKYFHETLQEVANKVLSCIEANITPIVCVDVTIIESQAKLLNAESKKKCIVAFEDPAHIGTGQSSSIEETKSAIKKIKEFFGQDTVVLYGGSASPENAQDFLVLPEIDGLLVGSASLHPDSFKKMLDPK